MARIGIDGDVLAKGTRFGDEAYLINLIHGLTGLESSNQYLVYTQRTDNQDISKLVSGTDGNCLLKRIRPYPLWFKVPFALPLAITRDRCDLLHTQYFVPPVCPCKVVLTIHDVSFMRHPDFFSKKEAWIFRRFILASAKKADRIITDSLYSKREVCEYFDVPSNKVQVIPLAVHPYFTPENGEEAMMRITQQYRLPFNRFILSVGEIQPRKNIDGLIKAFSLLRSETDISHGLVIIGKHKYKHYDIQKIINKEDLENRVVCPGFIPIEDLRSFYRAADLFVFPSFYEGFGLPPLEAMACGTPVAASRASCIPEVLGDAAEYFDPYDIESMATVINEIITSSDKADRQRVAGKERSNHFTRDKTALETLKAYNEVLPS